MNEKSILRFLVFEMWSFKIRRIVWKMANIFFCPRRCAMFCLIFYLFISSTENNLWKESVLKRRDISTCYFCEHFYMYVDKNSLCYFIGSICANVSTLLRLQWLVWRCRFCVWILSVIACTNVFLRFVQ